MKAFFQTVGLVFLIPVFLVIGLWKPWITFGIRCELNRFSRAVRASDRTLEQKEKLLDRIDAVGKQLNNGATPSIITWSAHIEDIRAMLKDGITADEVRLIERELEKIEQEMNP